MELQLIQPSQMAAHLLQGFAWGLAIRQSGTVINDLEQLKKLEEEILNEEVNGKFKALFSSQGEMAIQFQELDDLIDQYSGLEDLREFLYDLMVLKMIIEGEESEDEDVLESEAWLKLEEEAVDRGTELLNLLVYLKDCQENEVLPSLEDFLHEFLLVQDTEHQDEFFIYEDLIKNQELIEGSWEDIIEVGAGIDEEEMRDIFIPVLMFFKTLGNSNDKALVAILNQSPQADIHAGVFNLLIQFFAHLSSDGFGKTAPLMN